MDWNALIIGAGGGLIAGAVLLVAEYLVRKYEKKKDRQDSLKVRFDNAERSIDNSIFLNLSHGSTVELMKAKLGTPDRYRQYDDPVFTSTEFDEDGNPIPVDGYEEGTGLRTHSYLYLFKNAHVKITSKDNQVIDSLTVIPQEPGFPFGGINYYWSENDDILKFGEVKVTQEMAEACRPEHIVTRWDRVLALSSYLASPRYDYETYFCYESHSLDDFDLTDPTKFVGATIEGICLSREQADVYYIYFQELR